MSRIYQAKPTTQSPSNSNVLSASNSNNSVSSNSNLSKSSSASPPAVKLYHTENHHPQQHSSHSSSVSPTHSQPNNQVSLNEMEKIVTRLETVAQRLEKYASTTTTTTTVHHSTSGAASAVDTTSDPNTPSVNGFVDLLNGSLKQFLDYSTQIGGEVKTIGDYVKNLFNLQKALIVEASRSAKPANDVFQRALQPLSKQIEEIQTLREKNRKSEFFNHLSSISESIGALGWVTVSPTPAPHIKEMNDAGQFYTNRVLKDYKDKDPQKLHANWVKTWITVLNELQAYVKEHHTTGITWNARGGALDPSRIGASGSSASSAKGPSAGGAPPPPPPPTYDLFAEDSKQSSATNQQELQARLARELNIGTDITKTLKKVSDDQKTHKNPDLRASSTVPGGVTPQPSSHKTAGPAPNKPPKFELADKRWLVEYQHGKHDLSISNTEIKQTVYIYHCKDCTIKVHGKVNSISLDSCDRVGVVFDDVLATIEFVNSKNVQAQVIGKVPTISIDKTDGCQIYLSKQSLDVEIVSAKSSAMNILVPNGDDFVEQPIPEQFKTTLKNNKCVTVPTETA